MGWQRLIISPEQHQESQISLTAAQQHYLHRVLRLQQGDRFVALDGQGRQWIAALAAEASMATVVEAMNAPMDLPVEITLAAALPKGSGFDEVVRQATELGVGCIQPVISDRTLLKPSPNRLERWRRIAAEACEQSERLLVPAIQEPLAWRQAMEIPAAAKFLCVARGRPPHLLGQLSPLPESILVAVGPEGGWSEVEVEAAIAAGFAPASLGNLVLRSVTAPLVALSVVQAAISLGEAANHLSE